MEQKCREATSSNPIKSMDLNWYDCIREKYGSFEVVDGYVKVNGNDGKPIFIQRPPGF